MTWWDWLVSAAEPIARRIAVGLGFGYVTFEGVSTALEGAYSSATSAFGGLLSEVAQLLAMSGFFDAMAISSGGIVSGVAWMALKRWAVVT